MSHVTSAKHGNICKHFRKTLTADGPTSQEKGKSRARARDSVIFVCAAGVRSQAAAKVALESGFSKVYNLSGGTRNWVSHGLPLVQD